MPKTIDLPKEVRPFVFHGMLLENVQGPEARGDCPFCLKTKFYLNTQTSQWKCHVCGKTGNGVQFLRQLYEESLKRTKNWSSLAVKRGIPPETLEAWGVAKSVLSGEWVLPGYHEDEVVCNLYRYVGSRDKWLLMSSPGFSQGLFGVPLFKKTRKKVFVCEGPWDGMALWGILGPKSDWNVVSVPGAGVWNERWNGLLGDREVWLLYDNDQSGRDGVKVAARGIGRPVKCLDWSKAGKFPEKYDVRDLVRDKGEEALGVILSSPQDVSVEKVSAVPKIDVGSEVCRDWKTLNSQWERAMEWHYGLKGFLAVCLSSITSVTSHGEQLWFKGISPPAGGKTKVVEGLSTNRKYVHPESDITQGFYSGYKEDKTGKKDFSLISKLPNKTLITKDGDTILQSPYKAQILSQGRDIYDTVSRKHYGHGMNREYAGMFMTWIICGTAALRELDSSELGQRFLDWVIIDEISPEGEWKIAMRAMRQQMKNTHNERNGKPETHYEAEYLRAMRLTSGYIDYLKGSWQSSLSSVEEPSRVLDTYGKLAVFVSYLRARPPKNQESEGSREIAARVGSQLMKLSQMLAVVLNKDSIADPEVVGVVKKVALDTARGRTLEIVRVLHDQGPQDTANLARWTQQSTHKEGEYLNFLRSIRAVELYDASARAVRYKWRLTPQFAKVYSEVMGGDETDG